MLRDVAKRWGLSTVGLVFGFGIAFSGWIFIGPDHLVYALVVQLGFTFTGYLLGPVLVDALRPRYRVGAGELRLYSCLGAALFSRLLSATGWNRVVERMRRPEDAGLPAPRRFLRDTELSETGHLIGLLATAVLAVIAGLSSHPVGAGQILLLGFVLHGYPVMIQRRGRFRVIGERAGLHEGERQEIHA